MARPARARGRGRRPPARAGRALRDHDAEPRDGRSRPRHACARSRRIAGRAKTTARTSTSASSARSTCPAASASATRSNRFRDLPQSRARSPRGRCVGRAARALRDRGHRRRRGRGGTAGREAAVLLRHLRGRRRRAVRAAPSRQRRRLADRPRRRPRLCRRRARHRPRHPGCRPLPRRPRPRRSPTTGSSSSTAPRGALVGARLLGLDDVARDAIQRLWSTWTFDSKLRACIWTQHVPTGKVGQSLGMAHGFAGNVFALLKAAPLQSKRAPDGAHAPRDRDPRIARLFPSGSS